MQRIIDAVTAEIRREKVRAIINYCKNIGVTVNYIPLAKACGMFSGGTDLAKTLGDIMKEDHEQGQPLTTAIVVSVRTDLPGKGFFEYARNLGYQIPHTAPDEKAFARAQQQALGLP